ncbi:hypothetical protein J4E83_002296 [Alternaria metachromatica]|uniref:uncharacterized protein n=1 Tax=Alternaria metachromatica TaxID=283354 RepID=UPI0020C47152|nr:uncharacterized protein J4E83_002296 [Alternaria metachromatica]KAI4634973.1 hypothetical protein J4E83_002296 [Alternaria metachromatica]
MNEYASQEEHEVWEEHEKQEEHEVWEDQRKRPRKRRLFRDHQPLQVQTAAQKTSSVEQDELDANGFHLSDFEDESDPQTIGAERLAWSPVHVPFSDDALFDITLTGDDVVRMVETAFPVLSTSNKRMKIF